MSGPEARAVLAHAPAFVFETAGIGGDVQGALRQPGRPVLLGIKPREMLPDDVLGAIPLHPLGATVPGRHRSGRVEQEDRVIDDPLDQDAKQLVAARRKQGECAMRYVGRRLAALDLRLVRTVGHYGIDAIRR